jgi:hypothetical protein
VRAGGLPAAGLREVNVWNGQGPILSGVGARASGMRGVFLSVRLGLLTRRVGPRQPKEPMKNIRSIVSLLAAVACVSSAPAFAADVAAEAAQAATQAAAVPSLQQSVTAAAGYKAGELEVDATSHKITVTVVNSELNNGLPAGRSNEALQIVQALEKSMAGRAEFGQIMTVHLDFVSRQATESTVIQGFDFNKAPSGAFVPHTS